MKTVDSSTFLLVREMPENLWDQGEVSFRRMPMLRIGFFRRTGLLSHTNPRGGYSEGDD
jgi:hypothetical protein